MPGRDAGEEGAVGESRVKTFCKNLFHKRCCSPSGQREITESLVSIKAGKRRPGAWGGLPPPQTLPFVQPPKQSQKATIPLGCGPPKVRGDLRRRSL